MTLPEAAEILASCERYELLDHAFGGREVDWINEDGHIASGYFSGYTFSVSIGKSDFSGPEALYLVTIGKRVHIDRNVETGPFFMN